MLLVITECVFMVNAASYNALEFVAVLVRHSRRLQYVSKKRLSFCAKIEGVTPHGSVLLNQFCGQSF
jgi:hypothetical protein